MVINVPAFETFPFTDKVIPLLIKIYPPAFNVKAPTVRLAAILKPLVAKVFDETRLETIVPV